MLSAAVDIHYQRLFATESKQVTYTEKLSVGGSGSGGTPLTVVVGQSQYETDEQIGVLIKWSRDYIVLTSDVPNLDIGDQFADGTDTYEAISWDGCDANKKWTRIKTQNI
jgi:hypothetical protein